MLLEPDTVVSMNFWGFMPSVFDEMERYFEDFLRRDAGENAKAECLLPNMVGKLLKEAGCRYPYCSPRTGGSA